LSTFTFPVNLDYLTYLQYLLHSTYAILAIRLYVYTSICTRIESEILSSIRVHIDVKQINV
jgi:hypothetical protein